MIPDVFKALVDSMRMRAVFLRYLSVSLSSFVIDILLFAFIYSITANVYTSTYSARAISSTFNFSSNKVFVFKKIFHKRLGIEVVGYFLLVATIATASAVLVSTLKSVLDIYVLYIKIAVDTSLFFVNFMVQRHVLFGSNANNRKNKASD